MSALGYWVSRIDSSISDLNDAFAALDKKVTAIQRQNTTDRVNAQVVTSNSSGPVIDSRIAINRAAAKDPRAAFVMAQELPSGPDRNGAMQTALYALALTDPLGAWGLAQNLPEDNDVRAQTLRSLLKSWSATDPAEAAAMLATVSLPEAVASATSTTGVIEANWIKLDPEAGSKWIETLPVGTTRDSAIMALAVNVSDENVPSTFVWVTTMADYAKRGTTINKVVTQWAKTDPDAATKAVLEKYPNNDNGRQGALMAIISRMRAQATAGAASAANGN